MTRFLTGIINENSVQPM